MQVVLRQGCIHDKVFEASIMTVLLGTVGKTWMFGEMQSMPPGQNALSLNSSQSGSFAVNLPYVVWHTRVSDAIGKRFRLSVTLLRMCIELDEKWALLKV